MSRRKVEVRREEILRATVDEVIERGFASTRVADVAARLGISTGLVFYHFDSKEALLSQAFGYAAERDLERLDALAQGRGSAARRLGRILALYGPDESGAAWPLWIDAWATSLRSPEMAEVSRRLDLRWKDTVAEIVRQGVASGEMTCADPAAAAWRLTAMLDGLAVQVTVHEGVVSRRQVTSWIRTATAVELGIDPAALRR